MNNLDGFIFRKKIGRDNISANSTDGMVCMIGLSSPLLPSLLPFYFIFLLSSFVSSPSPFPFLMESLIDVTNPDLRVLSGMFPEQSFGYQGRSLTLWNSLIPPWRLSVLSPHSPMVIPANLQLGWLGREIRQSWNHLQVFVILE